MSTLDFEGRRLPVCKGDTIASLLHREGVTILSRSFKYHRPRGLYCVSGDCPNCMVTVDGEPAVRSCVTPALDGQRVARSNGWPSVDRDLLSLTWLMRWALPVGFYYKVFARQQWLWRIAEKFIVRIAGIGPVDVSLEPRALERRNHHPDVAVLGAGVAGLSAARAAAELGKSVVLLDEGIIGEQVPAGATRTAIHALLEDVRERSSVTIIERAPVSGLYEGPLVTAATDSALHMVHPGRIVVATGAVEQHAVFPGSDLPGVWLGRGAARMAGVHDVAPGKHAVIVLRTTESLAHLETLRKKGVVIRAALVPAALASEVSSEVPQLVDGEVLEARGRRKVTSVVVRSGSGRTDVIACDTLVLSLGFTPRDGLLRQAANGVAVGAGDVVMPGCSLEEAIASGEEAVERTTPPVDGVEASLPPAALDGFVCICEDVRVEDLSCAWREGFSSTEILKRYTTATMGPCQGLMCHAHLRAFVRQRGEPGIEWLAAATTARPPARGITLEQASAGYDYHIAHRTALHDRHLEMGGRMGWAGAWRRADDYGDREKEYWAVRRHVSIMDVGTLGKFRISGPDAAEFLERLYPMHVRTIREGRSRYGLLLNEAGYIFDDGMVGALGRDEYFLSTTSSGAGAAEAWFRDWKETWKLNVHIANVTAVLGAINVAGPQARDLLMRLTKDPLDGGSFPYSGIARITVEGIACIAMRVGFTGELSYEVHHPASRSVELWDALLATGSDLDIAPHGLEVLKLLRLEKGHIIIGQDTDFDTTPAKVGMPWAVKMDKPYFIGRASMSRLAAIPPAKKLVPIRFPGTSAPDEGAQLMVGERRVGYLTSSRYSPLLGCGVALGWVAFDGSEFPTSVIAVSDAGKRRDTGTIASGAMYDPEGARLRA